MVSEMTQAENFLQRLGRLDRFGKNKELNNYVVPITDAVKNGKSKDSSSRFLNSLRSLQSTKAWFDFLQNELTLSHDNGVGKVPPVPEPTSLSFVLMTLKRVD